LSRVLVNAGIWIVWMTLAALWTPIVLAAFLATAWWDPGRRVTGRMFRWGSRVLIALNPLWHLTIIGNPPPRRSHPFVVVSNHQSLADVLLLGTLPWEMKWLSKQSNFRVPFIGFMMRLAGDVGVRRDDAESRVKAYQQLREWLDRGVSVIIFPEGTRSRSEEMLPFRNGAFRLAVESRRPVLPLAVSGTRQALEKGSASFGRADAVVRILEPVSVEELAVREVAHLRDRVREVIDRARRETSQGSDAARRSAAAAAPRPPEEPAQRARGSQPLG
jgi:1-acyl-sn-glycerol-3-phosphate acyltransferase